MDMIDMVHTVAVVGWLVAIPVVIAMREYHFLLFAAVLLPLHVAMVLT